MRCAGSPRCSTWRRVKHVVATGVTWRRVKRVECDCRAGFMDNLAVQTDNLSSKPARTVVSS
ncbi:hypothetical protein QUB80_09155 [Chlorogloeopsis sp. ULAP01]|uniref:hypothetical protein n=1 Tax=Chlorogloeopsis sp. ULAP01 TaxID=3056483 RepID=UPI0025AAE4AC|nr:hypothetical protein [Chlorogloeopsis sp. ULAP01]MDM9380870.1 hypothetical protein [Chlorogloeopsis sp. ULAP01]